MGNDFELILEAVELVVVRVAVMVAVMVAVVVGSMVVLVLKSDSLSVMLLGA